MNRKSEKIADFMSRLPMKTETGETFSEVLFFDSLENVVGGNSTNVGCNGGDCVNDLAATCNSNAGNCKNYSGVCTKSSNGGACFNTSMMKPNPSNGVLCS